MRRKVTISQVAQIAGVSTTTVSRVMSNTGRISQATREKVFATIERLEYQPSAIAKGLIESKTYNIGLVLSENTDDYNYYENNFLQIFIQGMHAFLDKNNFDIVIIRGNENDEKFLEKIIKKQKFDGLILLKNFVSANNILKLKKMGFPFLVLGKPSIPNVSYIDSDEYKIVYEISEKLFVNSKNNIFYISSYEELFQNKTRVSAIKSVIEKNNLEFKDYTFISKNILERQMFLQKILSIKSNKSIICGDNISLIYLLDFCFMNNIIIPDDLQIVSLCDNEFLKFIDPPVSAVSSSAFDIGQKAALMIFNILHKNESFNFYIVESQINYRASTL